MGYYTDFAGCIELPGLKKKEIKRLENILKRRYPDFSGAIQIDKDEHCVRLDVWGNWKNYHEEFERLVMLIVRAFPKAASGWIDASGEERDDNWALEIGKGKVSMITYEQIEKDRAVIFSAKGGRRS